MKYIFIDSNIYLTCAMLRRSGHNPRLLQSLLGRVVKQDAVLLIPEVVDAEVRRVLRQRSVEENVTSVFGADGTQTIPLTPTAMTKAMLWTISADKPAHPNAGDLSELMELLGLPRFKYGIEQDCLILASLSEFMADKTEGTLVICSEDDRWYSSGRLVSRLQDEFPVKVTGYKDLTVLMSREFGIDIDPSILADYADMSKALTALHQSIDLSIGSPSALAAQKAVESLRAAIGVGSLNSLAVQKAVEGLSAVLDSSKVTLPEGVLSAQLLVSSHIAELTGGASMQLASSAALEAMQEATLAASRLYGAYSPATKMFEDMNKTNAAMMRAIGGVGWQSSQVKSEEDD